MIARVSPVETSRSIPRRISCCPIVFVNARTAIIGEDLLETKEGLMEGSGDGSASIIPTNQFSTLDSQPSISILRPSIPPSLLLLIPCCLNTVEHHGE